MNPPTSVIIYARVSTMSQNDRGISLSEQVDRCTWYAQEQKWEIETVVREVGSAYSKILPKLTSTIASAKPGTTILITTYDRFSRNVLNGVTALNDMSKRKIKVLSVQEPTDTLTPAGRYSFQILVAAAEFNSANTGFKVKATFEKLKREGNFLGQASYGFGIKKELDTNDRVVKRKRVVDEKEATIITLVEGLRNGITGEEATELLYQVIPVEDQVPIQFFDGDEEVAEVKGCGLDFTEIAELLNEYNVPFRKAKTWNKTNVKRVFMNAGKEMGELEVGIGGL